MKHDFHIVAAARGMLKPLSNRPACGDLWRRLRERFPRVSACVLMPDHVHVLLLDANPRTARWELGVELRAWSQRFHAGEDVWSVLDPDPIPNASHLKRSIRYVHLNPCRDGLAKDPLEWEWSTHRDLTGCVVDPWPDLGRLREVFRTASLGEAVHRYVSSDPSVSVIGTPMVRSPGEALAVRSSAVLWAAAVARREDVVIQRGPLRDLAVHVQHRLRSPDPAVLGMSPKAWRGALKRPVRGVDAVMRILADTRCSSGFREGLRVFGRVETPS